MSSPPHPGSKQELGRSSLFNHEQNDETVRLGIPFMFAFLRTYLEAFLFRSSDDHNTPLRWCRPCWLSGTSPNPRKSALHCLMVRSDFPSITDTYSAALVAVNPRRFSNWNHKKAQGKPHYHGKATAPTPPQTLLTLSQQVHSHIIRYIGAAVRDGCFCWCWQ